MASNASLSYIDDFKSFMNKTSVDRFSLNLKGATILECIDAMIDSRSRRNPKYGKGFFTLKKTLNRMQFLLNGRPIYTNAVSEKFWDYFISISCERLAMSTVKRSAELLRTTLKWASRYGAELQPDYDSFKIKNYPSEKICLSVSEVSQLYNFNFFEYRYIKDGKLRKLHPSLAKTLHKVSRLFVLACNLGQRYSDMIRIDKGCFESGVFTIMQQKTGNIARLKLADLCMDYKITTKILNEFNYEPPTKINNHNFDKYLKTACKIAGLTDTVRIEVRKGTLSTSVERPLYSLISSHTARRTFISYNIKRGINIETVKRASGHASLSSLSKYIVYKD